MMSLVFAAPATAAPAAAAKAEEPKGGSLVCEKEAVLGSRLPTRACLRQEEWDQRKTDSRDELQKIRRGQP